MTKNNSYELGYRCFICDNPIKDKDIPIELRKKISLQMVYHNSCV